MSLDHLFPNLVRHHVATEQSPLPAAQPGICWIWARNGIFKRACAPNLAVLVQTSNLAPTPGLADLLPAVSWPSWPGRLPGQLLVRALEHARTVRSGERTIEQAYHIVAQAGQAQLTIPPQDATATRVSYEMPAGDVLADLHSHHSMPAFFSPTDDADDVGLSVSAVMGRIFDRPTILVRLNCYGHRQIVPALQVFNDLGPFSDGIMEGRHARARH